MREFEVAVELLAGHLLIVRERLLDGLRRLAGDPGEHVEVGFLETVANVAGVNLHDAEQSPVGPRDGHAHHRADPAVEDAVVGVEPTVG